MDTTREIIVGEEDDWKLIRGCPASEAAYATEIQQLKDEHGNPPNWHVEFAVKGDVAVSRDSQGLHFVPHQAGAAYVFKVVLKDGSTTKAEAVIFSRPE